MRDRVARERDLGIALTADQPAADNTKVNQRDRNKSEPTADQQKETSADRQLTQQIRKALVKNKTLSTYGHNIKIVTQNGICRRRLMSLPL